LIVSLTLMMQIHIEFFDYHVINTLYMLFITSNFISQSKKHFLYKQIFVLLSIHSDLRLFNLIYDDLDLMHT